MPRLALLVVLATLLGACGGTSTPSARPASTPVTTPSATPTTTPTSASATASATPSPTATAVRIASGAPCRGSARPQRYDAVVWIWLENRSYAAGLPRMPYLSRLAGQCGVATDYRAITHPSLPNYLAAVSGSTGGVHSDCGPLSCPQRRATIFAQVRAAGGEWRSYEEAMPHPCTLVSSGRYAPKHNPAAYFIPVRTDCGHWDIPFDPAFGRDVGAGRLPRFAFVTPDLCHDGHDCSVAVADRWLATWLPRLLAGPDYRRGRTAVFVTWDEDDGGAGNRVATVVVAPSVRPGTRAGQPFTHYSLLRTTEEMLGLPPLLAARTAASMRAALRL